ncbi:hypothetical protein ABZS66_09755 [Dactylosporangium sp. NPDC005572]|uniref:hypothetical protein n=1 Tax=Dactylosporangium sp. NPDC005572 TaxID=3156889 RepID=UPI0033B67FAB
MQLLKHDPDGPHKLVRVETMGCAVNVLVGLHDENGTPVIAVEVEPALPDELGRVWEANGPAVVLVRCLGRQDERPPAEAVEDDRHVASLHDLLAAGTEPREIITP